MRRHLGALAIAGICLFAISAGGAGGAAAATCPNESIRQEQRSGFLPECRAYEMVSPVDKHGVGVLAAYTKGDPAESGGASSGGFQIAPGGNGLMFTAGGALPGAEAVPGFGRYVAKRSASGWTTIPVDPPVLPDSTPLRSELTFAFSNELSKALVYSSKALSPGAVSGQGNLYVRDVGTDNYELVATNPKLENWSKLAGYLNQGESSSGLNTVQFTSAIKLTPDAPEGIINTFEWRRGQGLRVTAIGQDGTPLAGGGGNPNFTNTRVAAISADGERVLFKSTEASAFYGMGLFLREGDKPRIQISASQKAGDDPEALQPATYVGASADLSQIYFYSPVALTDGAIVDPDRSQSDINPALYHYDLNTEELTEVAPDLPLSERFLSVTIPAIVSADGSTVFVEGMRFNGGRKLLVMHDDALENAVELDSTVVAEPLPIELAQASPSGRFFAFSSAENLTGYTSEGPSCIVFPRTICRQVYVYDRQTKQLSCASCNRGEEPAGNAYFRPVQVPSLPHRANVVTDDGLVAFETGDALVPQDTNGRRDVYVWKDGSVHLISPGQGDYDAIFADMSEDGKTIAFATAQPLVGADSDRLIDAYVARVDGGLASQAAPPALGPACSGSACQGEAAIAPQAGLPGSVGLAGAGRARRASVGRPWLLRAPAQAAAGRIRLRVSAPGRVRASGKGIRTVSRRLGRSGAFVLHVALAAGARRILAAKGRVTVPVHLSYRSEGRRAKVATVRVSWAAKKEAH